MKKTATTKASTTKTAKETITMAEAAVIFGGHYTAVVRHVNEGYFDKVTRTPTGRIILDRAEVMERYTVTKMGANGHRIMGPSKKAAKSNSSETSIELKPENYYMGSTLARNAKMTIEEYVNALIEKDIKSKIKLEKSF